MSFVFDNGNLVDQSTIFDNVGGQVDGTFVVPSTADQINDPSNTAGYPASSSNTALDVLKYGVGAITDSWKFAQNLDYKRFEATQGGVFQQGKYAISASVPAGKVTNTFLFAGIALAIFLFATKKG